MLDRSIDSGESRLPVRRTCNVTAKRNNCLRGIQPATKSHHRNVRADYASNFVSSSASQKKRLRPARSQTRDRWKRKLRPNRAFSRDKARSRQPREKEREREREKKSPGQRISENRGEPNRLMPQPGFAERNFSMQNFFNNIPLSTFLAAISR
ncbi:hypothetical protein ACS0PU_012902 [Formica fusca]